MSATATAEEQGQQEQQEQVAERQGSRWLYAPPSEEQLRDWFHLQRLHPGMDHDPYMGGIVVISATEKLKVTKRKQNGDTYVAEVERTVYVPYVKVDTRIAYFWDLVYMMNLGDEGKEYVGVIEPVPAKVIEDKKSSYYNEHMPEGFFFYPVRNNTRDESVNRYVGARWRVAIYERESYAKHLGGGSGAGLPVIQGIGTKQTPMAKTYADDNALMKAETGAIGRALGVAGILVVGTGVATAEDMQEAMSAPPPSESATPSERAVVPPGEPEPTTGIEGPQVAAGQPIAAATVDQASPQQQDEELRTRALALQAEMEGAFPDAWVYYRAWWQQRGFGALSTLSGPALRGAVIKLERDLDAAKNAGEPQAQPGSDAE